MNFQEKRVIAGIQYEQNLYVTPYLLRKNPFRIGVYAGTECVNLFR